MSYTTKKEMEFIDKIGTLSENCGCLSVVDMLRGYINGSAKRADWGEINQKKVIKHATKRLAKETELSLIII